jgi:hypothetical protein
LDAGAKIYASRVDSIYSEAYKILGGILVNETDDKDQPENPAHHMREQSRKEVCFLVSLRFNRLVLCKLMDEHTQVMCIQSSVALNATH